MARRTRDQLRRMPELHFFIDDSLDYIEKIDKALTGEDNPIDNPDLLEKRNTEFPEERINLWKTAEIIADFYKNPIKPVIISNACISGVTAIITGATLTTISSSEITFT